MTARRRNSKRRPISYSRSPRSPRRGNGRLVLLLAVLVGVNLYVFLWRGGTSIPELYERAALARGGEPASMPAAAVPSLSIESLPAPSSVPEREDAEDRGAWLEGEVVAGDSLGSILRREGLEPARADALIRALGTAMDLRQIRPGQSYRLHSDGAGAVTAFEFRISRAEKVVARAEGEAFRAEAIQAATEIRLQPVGGIIQSSLFAAVTERGEDASLASFFVDVFAYDLNFFVDQHPGDAFRMLVEKEYVNGEFLRYGRVLAAEYSGKVGTFRAFYWRVPGEPHGRYFDEEGRSLEKTFLKTPLKYSRISSPFSPKRMHPILHVERGHHGVDYAAPIGTPVWAAASGRIVFRGEKGGAGNVVVIEHDSGYSTTYMHLSDFRKGQRVGQPVRQKDVIGYVGQTGLATGPHLHFAIRMGGEYVDPLKMKMSRGPGVPPAHRGTFQGHVAGQVARLLHVPLLPAPAGVAKALASGAGEAR